MDDYVSRSRKLARPNGFRAVDETQLEAGPDARTEADRLLSRLPSGCRRVVLDETGREMGSQDFANVIMRWRDDGAPETAFCIGGADGVTEDVRGSADLVLSFGRLTWPHKLVRVLLAEQVYRALTLIAGTPYHRG